jgi:hypothetical protein
MASASRTHDFTRRAERIGARMRDAGLHLEALDRVRVKLAHGAQVIAEAFELADEWGARAEAIYFEALADFIALRDERDAAEREADDDEREAIQSEAAQ